MSSPKELSPPKARFILHSERLGPLPLVNHFIDRIGLEDVLERHIPSDARCAVPHARALGVLLRSIVVEREPIYRQQERSEEHTSELQSLTNLVCRLLLEKKKIKHPGDCRVPVQLQRTVRILSAHPV